MEAKIFLPVKEALQALVNGFLEGSRKSGTALDASTAQSFINEQVTAFSQIDDFETKLNRMDEVFEQYPVFSPLSEYCFDLLMINFFIADAKELDEGYLESEEWLAIEDNTLDRGSEFLNLLLYINECAETEVEPSLDDFLKEFLLTEDDLYQDEYFIYEPVIKNQQLADGSVQDIVSAAAKITEPDMQEIFVPLMVFFNGESYAERLQQLISLSAHKSTDTALFMALNAFADSLGEVDE